MTSLGRGVVGDAEDAEGWEERWVLCFRVLRAWKEVGSVQIEMGWGVFLSVLLFARVAGAVGCRGASSGLGFDLRVA